MLLTASVFSGSFLYSGSFGMFERFLTRSFMRVDFGMKFGKTQPHRRSQAIVPQGVLCAPHDDSWRRTGLHYFGPVDV
jgi:hypothetical protein